MRNITSLALALLLLGGASAYAQGTAKPAPKTKPAEAKPASELPPLKLSADPAKAAAEFKKYREAFVAKANEIGMAAESEKDPAKARDLGNRYYALLADYYENKLPEAYKVVSPLYLKDGSNQDAEQVVGEYISNLYRNNEFPEVVKVTDQLIAAGRKQLPILTMNGVSHFAEHNFKKASDSLTAAQKADPQNFPGDREAVSFLLAIPDYEKLWVKEQEIRAKEDKANDLPMVQFKTSKGDITLLLFEDEAPNTVANFISLVEGKKYDGTLFHRVIPHFMAQGGDPLSLDADPRNDGSGGPGYNIPCECYARNARKHFAGSLSMAHAGKDTGGSQFFLTHLPTPHLNADAETQRGHTVFGRVTKGLDVVRALTPGDRIEVAKLIRKRSHEYKPKTLPARPRG